MLSRTNGRINRTGESSYRGLLWGAVACVAWSAGVGPAAAQTPDTFLISSAPACVPGQVDVPLVEWDLPTQLDAEPGAITVDVQSSSSDPSRVWFVTRLGDQRLFRFTPGHSRNAKAQWRSWSLDEELESGDGTTGGLKKIRPSKDKRNVFVRTQAAIQHVDTQCKPTVNAAGQAVCEQGLIVFRDRQPFIFPGSSDLAVDDLNNLYSTAPDDLLNGMFTGYVQKLNPNAVRPATAADQELLGQPAAFVTTVTRWTVGGGAGLCPSADFPSEYGACLAGVDIDDKNQHLVYYTESESDSIAELNTKTPDGYVNVRFWSLAALSKEVGETVSDPRQLKVQRDNGKTVVWVVTGSGHLVRLIPQSGSYSLMSAHRMLDAENDPFGVAPDGALIGYTAISDPLEDLNQQPRRDKVGMLAPKDKLVQVKAQTKPAPITNHTIAVAKVATETVTRDVAPDKKTAPGRVERNRQGDLFVDAFINEATPQPAGSTGSMRPTGITPAHSGKVGSFFYAVGLAEQVVDPTTPAQLKIIRIGLAVLPQAQRARHARDDDDFDGDGKKNKYEDDDDDGDGSHNSVDRDDDNDCKDDDFDDHDDDNDGHDDKWDDPRKKETRNSQDHTTAPGGSTNHQMAVPAGATLVVAQAMATDLSTPLKVEIIGPTGVKLAAPLPTPGVAVATLVAPAAGTYTVRVTNLGLAAAALTTDLIVQEAWPVLTSTLP